MKKISSLVLTLSIIFGFCTNSFAMSQSHASRGASSELTFGYSDSYTSEIELNHSHLSIGKISISRNEIVAEDVTDEYPFLMLELKKPNEDYECYKETAKVQNRTAKFDIRRVIPGEYRLYLYYNESDYGIFDPVIYGDMSILIYQEDAYIAINQIYFDNCNIKGQQPDQMTDEAFLYYLQPSDGIESNDPGIIRTAEQVTRNCNTSYQKALSLHDFVAANIYYDYDNINNRSERRNQAATAVLHSKVAVCEGMTNLYIALCRSVGIPGRKIIGKVVDDYYSDRCAPSDHVWSEIYISEESRFIQVDVTWDDKNRYEFASFQPREYPTSHTYFDATAETISFRHLIRINNFYNRLTMSIGQTTLRKNGCEIFHIPDSLVIINDRTYIPLRSVFEAMGGMVDFNTSEDKIKLYMNESIVEMWLDYYTFYINGKPHYFSATPLRVGGKTMIPLRDVLEALGFTVDWSQGEITIGYLQ